MACRGVFGPTGLVCVLAAFSLVRAAKIGQVEVRQEPDCRCVKTESRSTEYLRAHRLFEATSEEEICLKFDLKRRSAGIRKLTWKYRCVEPDEKPSSKLCSVTSYYYLDEVAEKGDNRVVCRLKKVTVVDRKPGRAGSDVDVREVFQKPIADRCRVVRNRCRCPPYVRPKPARSFRKFKDNLRSVKPREPDMSFFPIKGATLDVYVQVMQVVRHKFTKSLKATPVFSYDASFLRRAIQAELGVPVYVDWINRLPRNHILPVDNSIIHHRKMSPEVQAVVHLHGAHVLEDSDGWPLDCRANAPGSNSALFRYRNDQNAGMMIAHDHCFATTRLNVQAGLLMPFFLRDRRAEEKLPQEKYDVPLLIKDFDFYSNGLLNYPTGGGEQEEEEEDMEAEHGEAGHGAHGEGGKVQICPSVIPEYFGSVMTVNGKVWPRLAVRRSVYRFTVVNACNSRFLVLQLKMLSGGGKLPDFNIVGVDSGYLEKPVTRRQIVVSPFERYTVLIDFSGVKPGSKIALKNAGKDEPFFTPEDSIGDCSMRGQCKNPTNNIMRFTVVRKRGPRQDIPRGLPNALPFPIRSRVSKTRVITLDEGEDEYDRLKLLISRANWSPMPDTGLTPKRGATEIWCFDNLTEDTHPMHIHQVAFQVVHRILRNGTKLPPDADELGPKDVVKAYPEMQTCVKAHFDLFGKFILHCHILEHEDWEMMQTFAVV